VVSFVALCSIILPAPRVKLDVHLDMVPNLVYQIDSVSSAMAQSRSNNYVTLWKENFLSNDKDKEALNKWRTIQNKIEDDYVGESVKFPITPVRLPSGKSVQARLAGLNAISIEDYGNRMSKVVSKQEAQELTEILKHFESAFGAWWNQRLWKKANLFKWNCLNSSIVPRSKKASRAISSSIVPKSRMERRFLFS
jgi:hypothetical protein